MLRNNRGFYVAQRLGEELFLMRAFICQQDKQINSYILNIEEYVETAQVEKWYETSYGEGEKFIDEVKHIEGVTEEDYDFKEMFTEVMPLYQRQAMFVALWGRLECKLDDIAKHLSSIKGIKIKKKSKGLSDFIHLISEIERLGVKITDTEECSNAVDFLNNEVREIRNAWVHNGGKVKKEKIGKIVKSTKYLDMNFEVLSITNEYLLFSLSEMMKISRKILDQFILHKIS